MTAESNVTPRPPRSTVVEEVPRFVHVEYLVNNEVRPTIETREERALAAVSECD